MSEKDLFYFKTFSVIQNRQVFRIGTDAVLLGTYTEVCEGDRVLDIGCGCGVLPLMLARKTRISADAIDISPEACALATINFNQYQGNSTLNAHLSDLAEWVEKHKAGYDRILSNPPFFTDSLPPHSKLKKEAKHCSENFLPVFFGSCASLLKGNGVLTLIYPYPEKQKWLDEANRHGFHLSGEMWVRPRSEKPFHRVVAKLTRTPETRPEPEILTLLADDQGTPAREYLDYVSFFLPGTVPAE